MKTTKAPPLGIGSACPTPAGRPARSPFQSPSAQVKMRSAPSLSSKIWVLVVLSPQLAARMMEAVRWISTWFTPTSMLGGSASVRLGGMPMLKLDVVRTNIPVPYSICKSRRAARGAVLWAAGGWAAGGFESVLRLTLDGLFARYEERLDSGIFLVALRHCFYWAPVLLIASSAIGAWAFNKGGFNEAQSEAMKNWRDIDRELIEKHAREKAGALGDEYKMALGAFEHAVTGLPPRPRQMQRTSTTTTVGHPLLPLPLGPQLRPPEPNYHPPPSGAKEQWEPAAAADGGPGRTPKRGRRRRWWGGGT